MNKTLRKATSLFVIISFLLTNTSYGLSVPPGSDSPQTRDTMYALGQKLFAAKRGPGAIELDVSVPESFQGEVESLPGIKFIEADYSDIPEGWENNPILHKTDLIDAFKHFRDNEARISADDLEIKEAYFEVDSASGELPIARIEKINTQDGTKYVLIIHTQFVQMWNHIRANDVWFESGFMDGSTRTVSVAWGIFYRLAKHEMADLEKNTSHPKSLGHLVSFPKTGELALQENEMISNSITGEYWLLNDSIWMWFLGSYCFSNTTRFDDITFTERINWFLESSEAQNLGLRDEFPNIAPDSRQKDVAIAIARLINYNFFSRQGVTVPETVTSDEQIKAWQEREALMLEAPLYATGDDEPTDISLKTDGDWVSLPSLRNLLMGNLETGEIRFVKGADSVMSIDFDLWIARHGKTVGNELKVLQGDSNVPGLNQLSPLGREQARESAESLFASLEDKIRSGEDIVVVTSTLLRSQETAKAFVSLVKERTGISLTVVAEEDADEISFGVAANRPYVDPDNDTLEQLSKYGVDITPLNELEKTVQTAYLAGHAGAKFEDGENFLDVLMRQKRLLTKLNKEHRGKTVVMVGHGTQLNAVRVLLGDDIDHPHEYIDWRGIELSNSESRHVGELSEKEKLNADPIKKRRVRDFHAHSNFSDGILSPAELVEFAAKNGIAQLSLTDHDTIEGLQEAVESARKESVNFVPGIEFTTRMEGVAKSVHILGYGFDSEAMGNDAELMEYLGGLQKDYERIAEDLCKATQEKPIVLTTPEGIKHEIFVTLGDLKKIKPGGSLMSTIDLARVVVNKLKKISPRFNIPPRHIDYIFSNMKKDKLESMPDCVQQYRDLFNEYGVDIDAPMWQRYPRTGLDKFATTAYAIKKIIQHGGIPVLAHPGEQKLTEEQIRAIASLGIKGMELYTYKHSPQQSEFYKNLARELGLFVTSGNDFHDADHKLSYIKIGKDRHGEVLTKGTSLVGFHEMGAVVHFADEWMPIDALDGKVLVNVDTGQIKYAEGADPILTLDFELWSLRHGASYGNEQYILQGDRNEPVNNLSETGQEQAVMGAEDLLEQLGEERIRSGNVVFVASELVRSQQTGDAFIKLVKERLGIDIEYTIEPLDNEFCFGEWGNQDRKTFVEGEHKDRIEWHRKWKEEFSATARPPKGDNFLDVIDRNKQMLEKFNEQHKGKTVVVFDHGTCITAKRVLLGDKNLVNKDGVINWQKANFANVELRNLTDPAGMEADPENVGQIMERLFADTSKWTGKDWSPVMMFEKTMKMAGTKEVDRITVRTLFENMDFNAGGKEYQILADFLTSDLLGKILKTPGERFTFVKGISDFFGQESMNVLNDLLYRLKKIHGAPEITSHEVESIFRELREDLTVGLSKWLSSQSYKYVLYNMYNYTSVKENVSEHSEIMKTTETLVLGALQAAFLVQRFINDKKDLMIDEKADKSLVTEVDIQVNELLKNQFASLGIPFIGEESEHDLQTIKGGNYIAVDPIDGTSNFVRMFNGELDKPALDNVTLISLVRDGVPVIGICLNHYTGELYIAVNDGKTKLESVQHLYIKGLEYPGTTGIERVSELRSDRMLVMGSSASDPVNKKYSQDAPTAQIGGLGFRIISLCNNDITDGLVYHKKQDAGLWDLAAAQVFASLNGVEILDGNGDRLDFTSAAYFPGHGAMATKGNSLGYVPNENIEITETLRFAEEMALNAGEIMKKYRADLSKLKQELKDDKTIVTQADQEIQDMLIQSILHKYPSHKFIAEEKELVDTLKATANDEYVWVIDPIDGTGQFVTEGATRFGVLISLLKRNENGLHEPVMGVFYAPMHGIDGVKDYSLFSAVKGVDGAFLNGNRISVDTGNDFESKIGAIRKSSTYARMPFQDKLSAMFGEVLVNTKCTGLEFAETAASGNFDVQMATVHIRPKIWDIAASLFIVEKAGGVVTDFSGNKYFPVDLNSINKDNPRGPCLTASSPAANKRILETIEKTGFSENQVKKVPKKKEKTESSDTAKSDNQPEHDLLVAVISEYIVHTEKNKGPGVIKDLDASKKTKIWQAVKLMHETNIEILLSQSIQLTDEVEDAVLKMNREMKKHGKSLLVTRCREDNLLNELRKPKDGCKRIVIADSNAANQIALLLQHPGNIEAFRDLRILNMNIPDVDDSKKTVYQAKLLMTAILARIIEKGDSHYLDMKTLLMDMLADTFSSDDVNISEFIDKMADSSESDTTPEGIVERVGYFLSGIHAINLVKQLEIELRAIQEFWTYA